MSKKRMREDYLDSAAERLNRVEGVVLEDDRSGWEEGAVPWVAI